MLTRRRGLKASDASCVPQEQAACQSVHCLLVRRPKITVRNYVRPHKDHEKQISMAAGMFKYNLKTRGLDFACAYRSSQTSHRTSATSESGTCRVLDPAQSHALDTSENHNRLVIVKLLAWITRSGWTPGAQKDFFVGKLIW